VVLNRFAVIGEKTVSDSLMSGAVISRRGLTFNQQS